MNDKAKLCIPISNEIVNDKTESCIPTSLEVVNDKRIVLLKKIREALNKIVQNGTIILFGSQARKQATPDSDWDILVLVREINPDIKHEIRKVLYDIELENDVIINPLIISKQEWENGLFRKHPIRKNVETEGVVLS